MDALASTPATLAGDAAPKPLAPLEVWLAVGSQELYGPAALAQVEADAREVAAHLHGSPALPVRVVAKPVLRDAASITHLCLAANAEPQCVGLVVWMHTFSPAKMWLSGLAALRKPLLHLHTQFERDLPWAEIDMAFMNLHQSAHGDREFAHAAARVGVRRTTIAGHWRDPVVLARIGTWTRAAAGWSEARSLQVARLGDNMREVAVTEGDKVEAQVRLGISVNGYGIGALERVVDDVSDADVDALVREYDDLYDVAPALRADGPRRSSLRDAARIELGLRAFLEAGSFAAFTDTFEDLGTLPQLPGLAVQRLLADGYGFGAEGDWKTAALVRIAKVMSAGLPGGTSFMEDYTYHLDPAAPKVLGAHMLEVCPTLTRERPRCEIHPLSIGGKDDPVRLVFTAEPGPAVVAGLLDAGTHFRLVVNEVEVVPPDEPLQRLPVARAVWRPQPSLATAAEAWLTAGAPHHTALSQSLGTDAFVDLAEMAGLELLVIDEATTVRNVRQELRWNEAYYRCGGRA
jgi:L-arabinose isomerase